MNDSPENDPSFRAPFVGVGHVIGGRYRVDGLLGRGGMGVVYAATHQLTQRRVAIKVLDAEPGEQVAHRERFLSEARTAAAVRHPNIVDILDMGMHQSSPYLVMELLEGSTLDPVLSDRRPVSYTDCLSWMLPIIGALATLHDVGIVHRDVKPSNIFLYRVGHNQLVPKLLDFGLARSIGDERLTRSGVVIGTPLYMAPEHASGGVVGPAADVWSAGVVLFECVTGALPYSSTDRSVIAAQVLAGHVKPVRQVRPDLPEPLAEAIDLALQRDLSRRHQGMRALAQALVAAATLSGIALPEQLAPVGLPDYPIWRRAAHRRAIERPVVETTHELAAPKSAASLRAETRRPWLLALLALALLGVTGFWLARRTAVSPSPASPPERASESPRAAPVSPERAPAPEVRELAVPAPDAAVSAGGSTPVAPLRAAPKIERRTPKAEPARRKQKPAAPRAPAEVETEWK